MMKLTLLKKYSALAFLTVCLFVILGFFASSFLFRYLAFSNNQQRIPPLMVAKLVDGLNSANKIEAVKSFLTTKDPNFEMSVELIDANGAVLYPEHRAGKKYDSSFYENLLEAYDSKSVRFEGPPPPHEGRGGPRDFDHNGGPREGGPRMPMPPPMFGGMGPMESTLIRLKGEPVHYLKVDPPRPPMGPPGGERWIVFLGPLSLFISLLLGIGATIFMVYHSMAKQVRIADQVISELQGGNLKARFPITRRDEFGQAMMRFNKMADEIEILVEHLRKAESSRAKLLQELTHDLRTPVASLRGLLETLTHRDQELTASIKKEFLNLSLKEVNYFSRLVDDLLFLAQVGEPNYQLLSEKVDLAKILNDEAYDCELRENQKDQAKKVKINLDSSAALAIKGDAHLLRRLFRNALENGISFAKSEVRVEILREANLQAENKSDGRIKVIIEDDGPGFSDEALNNFGERRLTRVLETQSQGRVSVGLGSVAMKAICTAHRGAIKASNRLDQSKKVIGARIEIELPA